MLFGHWLGECEVPDPYRLSREAYEHVYQLLVRGADAWVKTVTTACACVRVYLTIKWTLCNDDFFCFVPAK